MSPTPFILDCRRISIDANLIQRKKSILDPRFDYVFNTNFPMMILP